MGVRTDCASPRPLDVPSPDPPARAGARPGDAFLREFERLSNSSADTVAAWATRHPRLRPCRTLHDVVCVVAEDPDTVLGALILEAQSGSGLAALTVTRAMVPKLIVMARREPAIRIEDFLTHLWLCVMNYPLSRRPRRIAANLALDTRKALREEHGRSTVVENVEEWPSPDRVSDDPDPRRILRIAVQLGLVDPQTHAVMVSVFADGVSRPLVAQHHHVTPRTIQRRCCRGLRALADHSDELLAAL